MGGKIRYYQLNGDDLNKYLPNRTELENYRLKTDTIMESDLSEELVEKISSGDIDVEVCTSEEITLLVNSVFGKEGS